MNTKLQSTSITELYPVCITHNNHWQPLIEITNVTPAFFQPQGHTPAKIVLLISKYIWLTFFEKIMFLKIRPYYSLYYISNIFISRCCKLNLYSDKPRYLFDFAKLIPSRWFTVLVLFMIQNMYLFCCPGI